MALAELIGKLRTKKQSTERAVVSHYLELVRSLASGSEIDADEVAAVLDATGKDESDLERDVGIQTQRVAWAEQLQMNRQAVQDRLQAERELATAGAAIQQAIARLQPAVNAAQDRIRALDQIGISTMHAETHLAENVIDQELLHRESEFVDRLKDVNTELKPLVTDRDHKRQSLGNAEYNLAKLQARKEGDWVPAGIVQFFNQPKNIRELTERVGDLKSQVAQLDSAIAPRLARQRELQNELADIHRQKLQP